MYVRGDRKGVQFFSHHVLKLNVKYFKNLIHLSQKYVQFKNKINYYHKMQCTLVGATILGYVRVIYLSKGLCPSCALGSVNLGQVKYTLYILSLRPQNVPFHSNRPFEIWPFQVHYFQFLNASRQFYRSY